MLTIGMEATVERFVTYEITAKALGNGELAVFSTPAVIELVEETARKSIDADLEPGQGTVGTMISIAHMAPTFEGMTAVCKTVLKEIDRKRLVFDVLVTDDAGIVAKGTHERFIIDNEKFLKNALKRAGRDS